MFSKALLNRLYVLPGMAAAFIALGCSDESPSAQLQTAAQQVTSTQSTAASSSDSKNVPNVVIKTWSPQSTTAGQAFNVQPNGDSALWFEASGLNGTTASYELRFDDKKLDGFAIATNVGGSAHVPMSLISKPGKYPVTLLDKRNGKKYALGTFEVAQKK